MIPILTGGFQMFCSNCGAKLADNARFCMNCGKPVTSFVASPTIPYSENNTAAAPVQTPATAQPASSAAQPVTAAPQARASAQTSFQISELNSPQSAPGVQTPAQTPQYTHTPPIPGQNPPFADTGKQPTSVPSYARQPAQIPQYTVPVSGQNPPYAAPGMQAPAPAPRKKRTGLVILAVTLIAAIIGGLFYFFNRPGDDPDQYIQQAYDAYDAGDLNGAIEAMEKAYEMTPENEAVLIALDQYYWEASREAFADEDYGTCVEFFKKMRTLGISDTDTINSALSDAYNLWVITLATDGDTEQALEILEEARPFISEKDYNDRLSELTPEAPGSDNPPIQPEPEPTPTPPYEPEPGKKPVVENATDIYTLSQRIAGLTDNGDFDTATMILPLYYEDIVLPAVEAGSSYLVELDETFDYPYLIYYNNAGDEYQPYYVYYGELDRDLKRSGDGWILHGSITEEEGIHLYFYFSEWKNDKANGEFTEYNVFGEGLSDVIIYSGSVKDYLYDGPIVIMWTDGNLYFATYHDGLPEVLGDADDGQKIVAYTEDKVYWLKQSAEFVKNPTGLEKM
jgi:tetratricopeptide (TPR) repeat protein